MISIKGYTRFNVEAVQTHATHLWTNAMNIENILWSRHVCGVMRLSVIKQAAHFDFNGIFIVTKIKIESEKRIWTYSFI